jgi:hypothetical protein
MRSRHASSASIGVIAGLVGSLCGLRPSGFVFEVKNNGNGACHLLNADFETKTGPER